MNLDRTFFITTVTWKRTPLFRSQPEAELMMDVLVHYREQMRYVLHEFVIMPDHLHLLLTPEADISIERALQLIKGGFSYRLGKAKRGPVWQESFTNHRIRDQHDYERQAGYIRMNPVLRRLVGRPGDLLNPLRGSKEPLFHICAGAEGVIRNDHCAILKIREFLRFAE